MTDRDVPHLQCVSEAITDVLEWDRERGREAFFEDRHHQAARSSEPALDAWASALVDPERAGSDVYGSEADTANDVDEPGAEEAGIHVRDQGDL